MVEQFIFPIMSEGFLFNSVNTVITHLFDNSNLQVWSSISLYFLIYISVIIISYTCWPFVCLLWIHVCFYFSAHFVIKSCVKCLLLLWCYMSSLLNFRFFQILSPYFIYVYVNLYIICICIYYLQVENGNFIPLFLPENSMDREAWWAQVNRAGKESDTPTGVTEHSTRHGSWLVTQSSPTHLPPRGL